jgi:catechol 2,3-dioxygenase
MTASAPNSLSTSIHPATQMGPLSLTVADLNRSVAFYTGPIGLHLLQSDESSATLGVPDAPLLHLVEQPGAAPWPRDTRQGYAGLYHFAILLPSRKDLGRWLRNWLQHGYPLPGQGDHIVSEALYLEDPDGNGIEIYQDRPRDGWQWSNGTITMGTGPVDIRGLLEEAARTDESWSGMPAGTRVGHVHLQVGDIAAAERFYHDILGFDVVARMPTALFVSAGGYHHHLGMNTWHSLGAGDAPAGFAGLRFYTVALPSEEAREEVVARVTAAGLPAARMGDLVRVTDPWGNDIFLRVGAVTRVDDVQALSRGYEEAQSGTMVPSVG